MATTEHTKEHKSGCPRLQFWDANDYEARCTCAYDDESSTCASLALSDPDQAEFDPGIMPDLSPQVLDQAAGIVEMRSGWPCSRDDCKASSEYLASLMAVVREFVAYWTTDRAHGSTEVGCGMCGGAVHSTTCYVGKMAAFVLPSEPTAEDFREWTAEATGELAVNLIAAVRENYAAARAVASGGTPDDPMEDRAARWRASDEKLRALAGVPERRR